MRILLISTPTRTYLPNSVPPIGILILAACLEENGYEVMVLDEAHLREEHETIIKRIDDFRPDLVGIGGIVTAYKYIISLTGAIRAAFPELRIVLGGQITTSNIANCFNHMPIDYLIQGYGEIALLKLVRHLEGEWAINNIPGLSFRSGNEIISNPGREYIKNINDLPLPAYHHIDMDFYSMIDGENVTLKKYLQKTGKTIENHRSAFILGSWGCTAKCTFCIHEQEYVGIRYFSEDYMRRHIRLLHDKYNIRILIIGEEMFFVNPNQVTRFNRMMKESFPGVFFAASTRAEIISEELLAELATGNCFSLLFGFESGSQRILDIMKKGIKVETNKRAVELCQKTPISVTPSFIIGNVGEDFESIESTLKIIREMNLDTGAFFATPYPGGRIWDWVVQEGLIKDTHAFLLNISNRDAAVFSINLTPYPDFVIKMFYNFIISTNYRVRLQNESISNIKDRIKQIIIAFFPNRDLPLPFFIWKLIFRIYFRFLKLRRFLYTTNREKKYAFSVDESGALLPRTLYLGKISTRVDFPK